MEVKLTQELKYFGLHVAPPPILILPFLVEIVMIYTNNHVSSSMFHASSKPLHKKKSILQLAVNNNIILLQKIFRTN